MVFFAQKTPVFGPKNRLRIWGVPLHYGPEWRNISKAYECAFGSEVAETTERTQAISQENVFLKPICEQNSIV